MDMLSLPDELAFCQYNPMPRFRITVYRQGLPPELRMVQQLNKGITIIDV